MNFCCDGGKLDVFSRLCGWMNGVVQFGHHGYN